MSLTPTAVPMSGVEGHLAGTSSLLDPTRLEIVVEDSYSGKDHLIAALLTEQKVVSLRSSVGVQMRARLEVWLLRRGRADCTDKEPRRRVCHGRQSDPEVQAVRPECTLQDPTHPPLCQPGISHPSHQISDICKWGQIPRLEVSSVLIRHVTCKSAIHSYFDPHSAYMSTYPS